MRRRPGSLVLLCALLCPAVRLALAQPSGSVDLLRVTRAAEAYVEFIGSLGGGELSSREARQLAQLALILPEEVQAQVAEGDLRAAPEEARVYEGAGEMLLSWWRRQDPLPASAVNERLLEHIQRIQHAEAYYASDRRTTGLDDRGEIFVRYGRPEREVVVRFDDPEFTDKIHQFGLVVQVADFPDNVFWRYGHIDGVANFLFLEEDGFYRIAGTTELLPRPLRAGFNATRRGQLRSSMALAAMRTIYHQLAAEDPVFLDRYSQVDNYISRQDAPGRLASRSAPKGYRRAILDQDEIVELQPGGSERPPSEVVQSTLVASRMSDNQRAYQRQLLMPFVYTEISRMLPSMEVAVRTARFLGNDGSTRTEIYWGPVPGELRRAELPQGSVLSFTVVQLRPDYSRGAVQSRQLQVVDVPQGADVVIPAQQDVVFGEGDLMHLGLQWDLYRRVEGSDGQMVPGQRVRVGSLHVDSVAALDAGSRSLLMSDLKPVMIWSAIELVGASVPYPYRQVVSDAPLGLYFEIYNLRYNQDDYTRYQVTYRITGEEDAATSVTTTHTGTRARDWQEVLLDLSTWEQAGAVSVQVTVHDLTARRSVRRSIDFELF